MKKILLFAIFYLAAYSIAQCQNFTKTSTGLTATVNGIHIVLDFYSPAIVRVLKYPEGHIFKKESLSVVKKPTPLTTTLHRETNIISLTSDSAIVQLNLQTGAISFSDPAHKQLLAEKDDGAQFSPITDGNKPAYTIKQSFLLDKDEAIYGLGQQQDGKLNQRGQHFHLEQDNMKICIPFFQSIKGYGLFWDNYSPTEFTDDQDGTSFGSSVGQCADYYFLFGGNGDRVIAQMRTLTGQAPLMPLWVFGFLQSRERYKTQFELVDVVRKYRDLKIPLDGIIQDWQYWGRDSNWNAMTFDPATYPRPQDMVDSVHQLKAHLFVVAWPDFGPLTKQFAEFKTKNKQIDFDAWPPNAGAKPYDPYDPVARDIYWLYLNKGVFRLGVDAWWLDSSEPDHINVKEKDFLQPTYLGTWRSVQNAFPLEHIRGVYEHQRQTTSDKRVVILTRSAFAGQQRFGSSNWSGDIRSEWQVLRKQIPAGLSLSLTGIPYWNTDIGGFFAGDFVKGGGAKNPDFQELYVRWLQFGAFTPLMRSHGTDIPREIYQFGHRGDWAFDIQEKFINLRYHLLPYLYATAWNVTAHGSTFMRPLYLDFPGDKQLSDLDSEYLFGRSLLVCPVTQKGIQNLPVYLPAGADWFDFWTGERTAGGKTVNRTTPMDIMPLYVRAGSILPWGPSVQYAEEKKWDNLELRVYPGANGTFTLYEDENNSYNYEKGAHAEISFHWNDRTRTLTIDDRKGHFPGMLTNRKFNIILVDPQHGAGASLSDKFNKTVNYKGESLNVKL